MGLKTWWIGSRLERVEAKMKRLRHALKTNREHAERLQRDRDVMPAEKEARQAKLDEERERLTHQINRLHADEARLRDELRAARGEQARATA